MDREVLLNPGCGKPVNMFDKKVIDTLQPRAELIIDDSHDSGVQADIGAYAQQNESEEEDEIKQDRETPADR
jgi:hypothetical protein